MNHIDELFFFCLIMQIAFSIYFLFVYWPKYPEHVALSVRLQLAFKIESIQSQVRVDSLPHCNEMLEIIRLSETRTGSFGLRIRMIA